MLTTSRERTKSWPGLLAISVITIHNLNARIPFYRLPEVMKKIPELQRPKTTSLNPMEIIRCLRLKVWDVESQRMVIVGHI